MEIIQYKDIDEKFFQKTDLDVLDSVSEVILDVRKSKDIAIKKYTEKFDGISLDNFLVTEEEKKEAFNNVDEKIISAIKYSIKNVREFAKKQLKTIKNLDTIVSGHNLGHRIVPIEKVGCYVPGGNYPLPSTAIMTVVPAKVAKVKKVVVCSPKINPVTIVAASLSGADKIYKIGGVQAVAAMAYGTETVDKVYKIVGPGNKYVTAAKKYIYGDCGIDFIAGPSEVLIIADDKANPHFVALDMLAQCEHDVDARAYLICFSKNFALKVKEAALNALNELQTAGIARQSFEKSLCIIIDNINQGIELSNKKAPEHLELCFENYKKYVDLFVNYGSLFLGEGSAEVFGDYTSGTNHTLPTNQVGKYHGGLSVFDFIKIQTYQKINKKKSKKLIENTSILAGVEGLFAHKAACDIRKKK